MGSSLTFTSCSLFLLALGLLDPVPGSAQLAAGVARTTRLEVTTASSEAREAFNTGMSDAAHVFLERATTRLKRAIDLDSTFGLARVVYGVTAVGLTQPQRQELINRGVADASKASTGELILAMAYRENFRQNAAGARALLASAAEGTPKLGWPPLPAGAA